ncbi:MAG: beta-xylosidase [Deltaproteobacteria bacterium]
MSRGVRLLLGALATLCFSEGRAAAQAAPVQITVDATAPGVPLRRVWAYYGFDEVNYTTTPEGRALLQALVGIHDEPVYIRSHFLLNTDAGPVGLKWGSTNVYTENAQGNPIYDWTGLDQIMDTVTGLGALPLVEIAFMPQALSTRPTPYRNSSATALDGGLFYPPADYQKWGNLIRQWADHSRTRYADVESSWLWELWNEPDIGYWKGTPEEYDRLYDVTEAALHEVLPGALLAGPETASAGAFLSQFLTHCAQGPNAVTGAVGTRLDLVTFHAKGGVALNGANVQMNLGNQLRLHRNGFNIIAGFPQFQRTPIIIGEADPDGCAACSAADVPADAYRNSTAYGAYEIAMMKRSLELEARTGVNLRALLTWAFTFVPEPFFSGYRELSNNGIHKPVLNAFKLLGQLQGVRLEALSNGARSLDDILQNSVRGLADVDAMATLTPDGRVQVLVWNYHDNLVPVAATPVHLELALPPSFGNRASVVHLRSDESHGDAYTVWVAQGSPPAPSAEQLAELKQSMEPTLLEPISSREVLGGGLSLDFDLPRFGVSLLTLAPDAPMLTDPVVPDPGVASPAPPGGLGPIDNPGIDRTGGADGVNAPAGELPIPSASAPTAEAPAPALPAAKSSGCSLPVNRAMRERGGVLSWAFALLGVAALARRSRR